MEEHKKHYELKNTGISDYHEYSDGVHTGTGWTQDLADKAYQDAKREDIDHKHYTVDPEEWDSCFWNHDGDKVDRSDDSSSDTNTSDDSGCFITTACLKVRGLSDDCEQLEILRTFRDTYVAQMPEGNAQIREYYKRAPAIVEKVNQLQNSLEIWSEVFDQIERCVLYIKNGEYKLAYDAYSANLATLSQL